MIELTIYSRPDCHLCHEMKALVHRVAAESSAPARIQEIDISGDPDLEARYGTQIPVLMVNGAKAAKFRISEEDLKRILERRSRPTSP